MAEPVWEGQDDPGATTPKRDPLREWHSSHSAWLHAFLRRSLRVQPAEADDIVQDTWLRVIRLSLAEIEHPRAFLSRVALNIFRDRQRRESVRKNYYRLILASDRESADLNAMREQEASRELERLILDLPDGIRDVFLLSRFRHMTNKDIAAHFGISVKTVEWRISKAIEMCANRLQG